MKWQKIYINLNTIKANVKLRHDPMLENRYYNFSFAQKYERWKIGKMHKKEMNIFEYNIYVFCRLFICFILFSFIV